MKKNLVILLVIVVILAVGYYVSKNQKKPNTQQQTENPVKVDLDRPLVVGVVSWPGYVPGIVANGGFKENAESIFTKKYGLSVKFALIEDIGARGKAFAKGGPEGVDVVWSTIDFWANELPNFMSGGINGKTILQVDWSRGGDAIVVDGKINSVEDLKGKKISLVQYTPSHWFFESLLRNSKLSELEQQKIRDNLIFTSDVPTARSAFVSGRVDATVVWEPDVKLALKREGSRILTSSKENPELIADIMVAKEDFIAQHPKATEAFVRGWLDGVKEARNNPELAAQVLVDNEPMFTDLGKEATKDSLSWVYWPDLADNAKMFGLTGEPPLFDSIFSNAGKVWQTLKVIDQPLSPAVAKDDSILREIYSQQ